MYLALYPNPSSLNRASTPSSASFSIGGKAKYSFPSKQARLSPHSVQRLSTMLEILEMWLLAEQMKEKTFSTGSYLRILTPGYFSATSANRGSAAAHVWYRAARPTFSVNGNEDDDVRFGGFLF